MPADTFSRALATAQAQLSQQIDTTFGTRTDPLNQAMHYALEGGKALRGFFVLETARLYGLSSEVAGPAALAIECVHAYSLIHDDLPCMDDDDLRRGKPTVHKAWDESTAVLAGDALQAMAFEQLGLLDVAADRRIDLVTTLALAAGRDGMVGGQMLDIAAETDTAPQTIDGIKAIQKGKTGALIEWSTAAGARLAGADPAPLIAYGAGIGLAFQIADDILDVEGDVETVGKAVGKDADAGKATFVSLLGLDEAKAQAQSLVTQAIAQLDHYGEAAECLRNAARFVIDRKT